MGRLIAIDFYKIFRTKFFYIIGLVLAALCVLSSVSFVQAALKNYDMVGMTGGTAEFSKAAWRMVFLNFGNMDICLVILATLFLCSEFSFGTMKNIATKGYTREGIYLSKFFVSLSCMAIYLGLTVIVSLVTSLFAGATRLPDFYSFPSNIVVPFLFSLLFFSVYISIALMISSLIRKSGSSLAIYVVCTMVVSIVPGLLSNFIHSTFGKTIDLQKYLYSGCFSEITQYGYGFLNTSLPSENIARYLCVGLCFLALTLGVGIYYFRERDI